MTTKPTEVTATDSSSAGEPAGKPTDEERANEESGSEACRPGFFRSRQIGDDWLVTNQVGQFVFLTPEEMDSFVRGQVKQDTDLYGKLDQANLFRDSVRIDEMAERLSDRRSFLDHGPSLHVVVTTLRCNVSCVYCQASRAPMAATDTDMTPETADRVVDTILETTSPVVTIEFQGGEPMVNFPIVQRIVDRALEKNREAGKALEFNMVTNLTLMDEEKLEWLLDRKVQICTSIDGPPTLHDRQRSASDDAGFSSTARWIRRINEAYTEAGLDPSLYRVEALLTTTREALSMPKEIVDTYVDLGCRAMFLRPLSPFGFANKTGKQLGYPIEDYLTFYRSVVEHMLDLNEQGVEILERYAAIFATKILRQVDPNFLDIRSPCGAGIGQLAYHHDGSVFPCDEGRMVYAMNDDFFLLGNVHENNYNDAVGHETIRAMLSASTLEGAPDCTACAYAPYCGVCPVHNYCTQGSLHGRARDSTFCAVYKGIQDFLFEKIKSGDPKVIETLERWSFARPRDHFVHD